jgi:hypothetical protein
LKHQLKQQEQQQRRHWVLWLRHQLKLQEQQHQQLRHQMLVEMQKQLQVPLQIRGGTGAVCSRQQSSLMTARLLRVLMVQRAAAGRQAQIEKEL